MNAKTQKINLVLASVLFAACGQAEPLQIDQTEQTLLNATTTTGFAPVVQILIDGAYICTATAISDDLLLTAMHCLKETGTGVHDSVEVYTAHGDNDSAEGAYSRYFMFAEEIYDGSYTGGTELTRDIALIKFGQGTFSSYYPLGAVTASLTNSTVTILGFGGNSSKEYATDTVTYTSGLTGNYAYIYTNNSNSSANLEGGDSGGPILVSDGAGSYKVVGVNKGTSGSTGLHPIVTSALYNYVEDIREGLVDYCVEAFEHSNYDGNSWSWCMNSAMQSLMDAAFSDPWKFATHANENWNDEITALIIPDNMSLRVFQHSSFGGSSRTFQTMYSFGKAAAVSSLTGYSFNDMISSWKMTYATSPSSLEWNIEIMRHGKCLDLENGNTANGGNIHQWSCQDGNTNQEFRLRAIDGYYQLIHNASGKCVDVAGGNSANGTNIQLWDCSDSNWNQQFTLSSNNNTSDVRDFTIRNRTTNKCLDLDSGDSDNGTEIHLWDCDGNNSNQNFALKQY